MSGSASTPRDPDDDTLDPLLDFSLPEEQELPFATVGTTTPIPLGGDPMEDDGHGVGGDRGDEDTKVSVLHMESRMHVSYLETVLAVGIDGCKQIREILEEVIRANAGRRIDVGED